MIQSEKELENYDYSLSYYRNDLLPQLDLTFSTWSPGQSGVKFVYDNNNPFTGNVIGKVEGSRMDALKQALKMTYKNWSLEAGFEPSLGQYFHPVEPGQGQDGARAGGCSGRSSRSKASPMRSPTRSRPCKTRRGKSNRRGRRASFRRNASRPRRRDTSSASSEANGCSAIRGN